MPEPRFEGLRQALLRGGIATYYVNRTLIELREHYADLEADALSEGASADDAAARALAALGSEESLVSAVLSRRELRSWSVRCPWAAALGRTVATMLMLPAAPVVLCVDRGTAIMRWSASVGLSLLVTAGMLLTLQWLIVGH